MAVLIGELGDKLNNKLPSPPVMPVITGTPTYIHAILYLHIVCMAVLLEPKPFNLTAPKPRTIDVSELTEVSD